MSSRRRPSASPGRSPPSCMKFQQGPVAPGAHDRDQRSIRLVGDGSRQRVDGLDPQGSAHRDLLVGVQQWWTPSCDGAPRSRIRLLLKGIRSTAVAFAGDEELVERRDRRQYPIAGPRGQQPATVDRRGQVQPLCTPVRRLVTQRRQEIHCARRSEVLQRQPTFVQDSISFWRSWAYARTALGENRRTVSTRKNAETSSTTCPLPSTS